MGLTLLGVLSASIANVMQASERLRTRPIASMLAWGMVYGVIANALVAWALYGPPTVEYRLGYWAGLAYLGLFASALAFTFYFGIIRAIGPGRAAYSSLIVPVIAMALSTLFEGYRWSLLAVAGGLLAMIGLLIALEGPRAGLAAIVWPARRGLDTGDARCHDRRRGPARHRPPLRLSAARLAGAGDRARIRSRRRQDDRPRDADGRAQRRARRAAAARRRGSRRCVASRSTASRVALLVSTTTC